MGLEPGNKVEAEKVFGRVKGRVGGQKKKSSG